MYELAVFIGRFQPFHLGHKLVLDNGFKVAKNVLVFLGSHDSPRTMVNPWTSEERAGLINSIYAKTEFAHRIDFKPIVDFPYNDTLWMRQVQQEVYSRGLTDDQVCLIGEKKDEGTSFYLKMFPQWDYVGVPDVPDINATDIRESYFEYEKARNHIGYFDGFQKNVPKETFDFLVDFFSAEEDYEYVKNEFEFQYQYDKKWENSPYPPMFITVDSVVVQSGHVLLVKRRAHPGKGLWALPGGYLNKNEKLFDGAIRELMEETKIKVPIDALKGSFVEVQVFDAPNRSTRGRIVTHAHSFKLKDGGKLPRIKGSDDAEKAKWIPFSDIKRSELFEDHHAILETMISRLNGDRRQ
jgi:bifunctional NMN adenylyltransferase/nudix hydrolase